MTILKKLTISLLIIFGVVCLSCKEDEVIIKFQVVTTCPTAFPLGGHYFVNDSRPILFSEKNSTDTTGVLSAYKVTTIGIQELGGYSYFEASIEDLDNLSIKAIRTNCSYAIDIYIYEDGDKVDSASLPSESTGCTINQLTKDYSN
ncbi:MAG: hypothetical protein V1874_00075 [Spirochaetota bacterium]